MPVHEYNRSAQPRTALLAGAGNIGSFLAPHLPSFVSRIRLIDRGRVEDKNVRNQNYRPADVGKFKVDALAERLREACPDVVVETLACDLEDVPVGDFADVDVCLGALDSLRARQVLISERAFPLGIPVIDGGVGTPFLGRVHLFLPSSACLECAWHDAHYRHLAREMPCVPGAGAIGPDTAEPACVGAVVAGMMAAEALRLLNGPTPDASQEIFFDLANRRCQASRMRRAARCRFDHEIVTTCFELGHDFEKATMGHVRAALRERYGARPVQLELRRGLFGARAWPTRYYDAADLEGQARLRLADLGLSPRDRIRVRIPGEVGSAYLCLTSPTQRGWHGIST